MAMPQSPESQPKFATRVIHYSGEREHEPTTGAVVPPISLSTTFAQEAPAKPISDFEYSRSGNPNRDLFEKSVATLENAKYGLAFASGSATTASLIYSLPPQSHILSVNDVYGGTNRFLNRVATVTAGMVVDMIDMSDTEQVLKAVRPDTRMIWIETPTNPTMRITDIQALSRAVREGTPNGKDIMIVVDNTFMTPYFQKPLDLGADVVVHSVTKYLNGHCDVIMGVLLTNRQDIYDRCKFLQNAIGAVPSPFDCYLACRGMKTLHVRMDRHAENAMRVALFLESHPKIAKVHYPGLPSHAQHQIALKQQSGFGGMISFSLRDDLLLHHAIKLTQSTKLFTLAESLGGIESLIELPAVMTHASVSVEQRRVLGISDTFIRISVGIEDADDLIADLSQALKQLD